MITAAQLTTTLNRAGIPATNNQSEILLEYRRLLLEWTERTNLISRNTMEDFDSVHLLDCILPLRLLPNRGPLVDLGSGGGLPGILIKILRPDLEVGLAETRDRKIKFLKTAIASLNLEGIRTIDPSREKPEKKYGILVSRAFGPLQRILRESRKYLTEDGIIFAYKGKQATVREELRDVPDSWEHEIIPYSGPAMTGEEPERTIVILSKREFGGDRPRIDQKTE